MKSYILVCIDNKENAKGICDAAIYFANLLNAGITLLHTLKQNDDLEINITINPNFEQKLFEDFANHKVEEEKNKDKNGKELLEYYKNYCEKEKITTNTLNLHGDIANLITIIEKDYKLLIVGKFEESELNSKIKEIIKNVNLPIFLANKVFKPIQKALYAYDGSDTLDRALNKSLINPSIKNIRRVLVHLNKDEVKAKEILEKGKKIFIKYGKEVSTKALNKITANDLVEYANSDNFDIIVMGAYKNMAIKHIIFGSFTNEVLKKSKLPLLILKNYKEFEIGIWNLSLF